jgi:hypothetical protein
MTRASKALDALDGEVTEVTDPDLIGEHEARPQWVRRLEVATGKRWIGPAKRWITEDA